MINSFTFKGVDFGTEAYRITVVGGNYQQMPKPRVNIDEYAQADGGATQGSTFGVRDVSLVCAMASPDIASRQTLIDNIVAALAVSQAGPGDLTIGLFPGKVFTNARLTSDLTSTIHATMEEFTLEFVADPWPSAATPTNGGAANNAGGTTVV